MWEARRIIRDAVACERCGGPYQLVQHRDANWRNNDASNLEPLCRRCHMDHHRADLLAGRQRKAAKLAAAV
jgi:hypothetical protein